MAAGRGFKRPMVMAAMRHGPGLRQFHQRLIAAGKKPTVALVAVMRKMSVICNAGLRWECCRGRQKERALQTCPTIRFVPASAAASCSAKSSSRIAASVLSPVPVSGLKAPDEPVSCSSREPAALALRSRGGMDCDRCSGLARQLPTSEGEGAKLSSVQLGPIGR
jgi:hypothetical protein